MAGQGSGLVTIKAIASVASPWQRLYRCLNVMKAISFVDDAACDGSIIKNPNKGQERKMNDEIRKQYYVCCSTSIILDHILMLRSR